MSSITVIQSTDLITNSRANINDNFANLNTDKIETSVLDTDTTLAANSDSKVATQKAVKAYVDAQGGQTFLVPTGAVLPYAAATAPANFLLCDGTEVSRSTYSTLFSIISTTYGVGDGSTTFTLPDLQGVIPVGRDSGQTEFDTLGETGGAKTHTLITAEMPAHTHATDSRLNGGTGSNANIAGSGSATNGTIDTSSTGGGGAHNNLQPYIVLNYIIKT